MKIGVTGPDLLLSRGGAQIHTLNVISILSSKFNFIYFPNPCLYGKYRKKLDEVEKNINILKKSGIKVTEQYYEIINGNYTKKEVLKKYSNENVNILFNFDYLNTCLSPDDFTLKLSSIMNLKFAVTLQGMGDFNIHFIPYIHDTFKLSHTIRILLIRAYQYISRHILLFNLTYQKRLYKILIVNSSYNKNIKIKYKNIQLLKPSNGITNSAPIENSNINKENKIIFMARLSYTKGIFELPRILYLINQKYQTKLVLIGQFLYESEKQEFFRLIDKYKLNNLIDYRGFLEESSLYRELSTARLMVYPSHSDSFSIAVSQALLCHTPVVAYNIPGLEVYNTFNAVKLVKEFDYTQFVDAALAFLNMEDCSSLFNQDISDFIEFHTWSNVANQYAEVFNQLL